MARKQTPSQTIGPFFSFGLTPQQYSHLLSQIAGSNLLAECPEIDGTRIRIAGHVFDGAGEPAPDAMIEIWQADAQGRYAHPADSRGSNTGFAGFGRMGTGTDPAKQFIFDTLKPASVDGDQAPHINVCLFARGMPNHAYTRIYFSDEQAANEKDPVLAQVPAGRRPTLIAEKSERDGVATYRFDIHLQGERETVFFDL